MLLKVLMKMSSIEQMLNRKYKQKCVYWGNPINDGQGGFTWDDPIELSCRWEEMRQLSLDNTGVTENSRAVVYLSQDVDEEGMLYLGLLNELTNAQKENPREVDAAFFIKRFRKIPALGSTLAYLRIAYLTPSLSFGGF